MNATVVYQPVTAPGDPRRYTELLLSGVLIDVAGNPLVIGKCDACGDDQTLLNNTCMLSVPCSSCLAKVGEPCSRPSEHKLSNAFGGTHAARKKAVAAIDDKRIEAGDPTIPAPWRPVTTAQDPPVGAANQMMLDLDDFPGWKEMFL